MHLDDIICLTTMFEITTKWHFSQLRSNHFSLHLINTFSKSHMKVKQKNKIKSFMNNSKIIFFFYVNKNANHTLLKGHKCIALFKNMNL